MTTFTVNIDDIKAEKAIKAFLDALELKYDVNYSEGAVDTMDKKSQQFYGKLKKSLQEVKRWENGKTELRDARDILNEL